MADLLYVALTIAFFAAAVWLVRGCDRVIGPDDLQDVLADTPRAQP
jgi:hypothetical protein